MSKIIKRIIANTGIPGIVDALGSIPSTDLQSLLLEVYRVKAKDLDVRNISRQAVKNRFVSIAAVNQRDIIAFDHLAYGVLSPEFEAIELSPVAPFGVNKVLGGINQNNVVTTVRNTEVIADPTSALSLLCAQRRGLKLKQDYTDSSKVSLATSHRIMRGQSFDDINGFTPHFRAFALATAGRDVGFEQFEREVLMEHISFYLTLLDKLVESKRYNVQDVTVSLSDIRVIEQLIQKFNMDRSVVGRNTQNPSYSAFREYGVQIPSTILSLSDLSEKEVSDCNLSRSVEMLRIIDQSVVPLLKSRFPNVTFNFDIERTAGMGYYSTLCFKVSATNAMGSKFPLVDGGMSTWTQRILSSKKERYFSSGIGSELFCNLFHKS